MKFTQTTLFLAALLTAVLTAPAQAGQVSAFGSGWINSAGTHNSNGFTGTQNLFAGWESGNEFNDWVAFNLPNLTYTNATLYIYNTSVNKTLDTDAIYALYKAASFSFSGLEAGDVLGSITLGTADTGVSRYVGITLNAEGISALNAAAGKAFYFGGSVSSSYPNASSTSDKIFAWGGTSGTPAPYLVYTQAGTVPEPSSLTLLAGTFVLLAGFGRVRANK